MLLMCSMFSAFNGFKDLKLFGRDPFKLMVLVLFGDLLCEGQNWGNNYEILWLLGVYNATLLGSTTGVGVKPLRLNTGAKTN